MAATFRGDNTTPTNYSGAFTQARPEDKFLDAYKSMAQSKLTKAQTRGTDSDTLGRDASTRAQSLKNEKTSSDMKAQANYEQAMEMKLRKASFDSSQSEAVLTVKERMPAAMKASLGKFNKNIADDGTFVEDEDSLDFQDPVKVKGIGEAGVAVMNAPKGDNPETWYQNQTAILTQRIAEIEERGGDPRHTINLLNAKTPEERDLMSKMAVQVAEMRGLIPKAAKVPAYEYVKNLTTGKETMELKSVIAQNPSNYAAGTKSPTTSVTTNVGKGENKFSEAEGTASSKEITELGKTIVTSKKTLNNVGTIEALLKKIPEGSLLTGTGAAPLIGKLAKYAEALGFEVKGLGASEMIDMLAKKAAKDSKVPGSGTYTDADFQIDLQLQPGIEGTAKGNALKIKYIKANAEYEMGYAKEARKFISKNKGRAGIDEHMAEYEANHPYKETLQKAIFSKTLAGSATTRMIGPDGTEYDIPAADVEQARKQGLK